MSVHASWTKSYKNVEDKNRFKEDLIRAQSAFKTLTKILEERMRTNAKARLNKEIYTRPNWALEQADITGESRAYEKVIELLKKSLT